MSNLLTKEPADRSTIERLYCYGYLDQEGKKFALSFLEPHSPWILWIALVCKMLGGVLIAAALYYLFSKQWVNMNALHRALSLGSIFACVGWGLFTYPPQHILKRIYNILRPMQKRVHVQTTIQGLLDWLENRGLLVHKNKAEAFLLCGWHYPLPHPILQCFMGIGASIGAVFITFYLWFHLLISSSNIIGLTLIFMGLIYYHLTKHTHSFLHALNIQVALFLVWTGKLLFVISLPLGLSTSLGLNISIGWEYSITLGMLTLATYYYFPIGIDRFVSCLILLTSISMNLMMLHNDVWLFMYFASLFTMMNVLLIWKNRNLAWDPLLYSGIFTLWIMEFIITVGAIPTPKEWILVTVTHLDWFQYFIGLAVILQGITLSFGWQTFFRSEVILTCILLSLCAFTLSPALLFSMYLLMIGYAHHQRLLTLLAGISLPFALLDFFDKSQGNHFPQSLALSGCILLFTAFLFEYVFSQVHSLKDRKSHHKH